MRRLRWCLTTIALLVAGLVIGHALGYGFDVLSGNPIDTDFDAGFWAALLSSRAWRTNYGWTA